MRAATFLAPCNRPLYEFVAQACGASELIDGGDWRELQRGGIDFAFVCSPPMIWLGDPVEAIAAPVLTDSRFGGEPLYSSEVIVHRDSRFQSLEDLRGTRWAINEPSSWSGYWVTLQRVGSWDFFGEVVEAGFHEAAMRMRIAEQVRVIETLGPAPSQPVVVRAGLEAEVKTRIRETLLQLRDPLMNEFGVDRFVPAPDYSAIADFVGAVPATNGWR